MTIYHFRIAHRLRDEFVNVKLLIHLRFTVLCELLTHLDHFLVGAAEIIPNLDLLFFHEIVDLGCLLLDPLHKRLIFVFVRL